MGSPYTWPKKNAFAWGEMTLLIGAIIPFITGRGRLVLIAFLDLFGQKFERIIYLATISDTVWDEKLWEYLHISHHIVIQVNVFSSPGRQGATQLSCQ